MKVEEDAAFESVSDELLEIAQKNNGLHASLNTIRTTNLNKSQYKDIRVSIIGQATVFADIDAVLNYKRYSYSLRTVSGNSSCYFIEKKQFLSIFNKIKMTDNLRKECVKKELE